MSNPKPNTNIKPKYIWPDAYFEADVDILIDSAIENEGYVATIQAKLVYSTGGKQLDVDWFTDTYEHEAEGYIEARYKNGTVTVSYEIDDCDHPFDEIHNIIITEVIGDIEV